MSEPPVTSRKIWTPAEVVDVSGPPALLRNYLEQRDVRRYLLRAAAARPIRRAYDVGSGFGRLTPVLTEVAAEVTAFEREPSLVETARSLLPDLTFVCVDALYSLPVPDASADFVLTFTVLQHLADDRAERTLAEIARVVKPSGYLLLVEETDTTLEAGDSSQADAGYTRGRSVEWYVARAAAFVLEASSPRQIEPGYPRPDVGTYMLFRHR